MRMLNQHIRINPEPNSYLKRSNTQNEGYEGIPIKTTLQSVLTLCSFNSCPPVCLRWHCRSVVGQWCFRHVTQEPAEKRILYGDCLLECH